MRILTVNPGASVSTIDVFRGLYYALKAQGHELVPYALDARIGQERDYLASHARRNGHRQYSTASVLYLAGAGVMENTLRHSVDWVLVVSGMYLHPEIMDLTHRIVEMRDSQGRRIRPKRAVVFTESPYDDERQAKVARFFDVCFTNERTSVERLKRVNPNTYYLPHAYNPEHHYPGPPDPEVASHDVVFVGTGFAERGELLRAVNWDGIDFGLYGQWDKRWLGRKVQQHLCGEWQNNRITAALYRNAKIGINCYRESEGFGRNVPRITYAESLSPRAYELAACGTFTLSHYRAEVAEVFGDAVPTFQTPQELEELIRAYLADDEKRRAVAASLPGLVAGQTFSERADVITRTLEAHSETRELALTT